MNAVDNPKSIKYYVKRFFIREKERFKNKTIVDFPAGNGITSNILHQLGAKVLPFDLFPEYFKFNDLKCEKANINDGIPLDNNTVDVIISQEGIEHFENQLSALQEFNRILKLQGSLIITTPNYSGLTGRMSYLLSESELFNKQMPQNELDDIWMSSQDLTNDIYYGHIFLIGLNKLRLLAKLTGFKIKNVEKTRMKTTSMLLLPVFYPFIYISNLISYKRNIKKHKDCPDHTKKKIYDEIFHIATNPRYLVNGHIFVEFEKEYELQDIKGNLYNRDKEFGTT